MGLKIGHGMERSQERRESGGGGKMKRESERQREGIRCGNSEVQYYAI